MADIKRGEIYYADLSPVSGSEQGGFRPVIILQNDIGNKYSPTTIVAPLTTAPKKAMPTHVILDYEFLETASIVLLEQIRKRTALVRFQMFRAYVCTGIC